MSYFPYKRESCSTSDTKNIASEFIDAIKGNEVIAINGDLGAGKTFFVKCIAEFFGINNASSPTFAIVNEYYGKKKIYHFDFYRINNERELIDLGIEDYFNDDALVFIEWADMFSKILPEKRIEINIELQNSDLRIFSFKQYE